MSVTLHCPRCKSENPSGQRYCKRCGFGLDRTGMISGLGRRSAADEWVGKTINGKYRITAILGEGGFGTVFRAELLLFEDHKPFALKLLHPDLCENEHFRRRFLREAAMAMALVHPNAIQVREFDQTEDGLLYFTMDYCPGEPLHLVLAREGFFTINRAIPLVLQVLSVLEAAHAKEIIHRDLKPDNVFLVRDPAHGESAFVGDFGLAKSIERNNRSDGEKDLTQGGIVGTPRYMSPEQGRGEPLDGRSDLYSVGVMFFEMITGQLPPRLEGKGRVPRSGGAGAAESPSLQRLRELIPPNLVIPRSVLEVVARALEPRPAARFQSATEFREALEALPTYTPTYNEPRLRRRRPGRLVAAMLLLFIAAGGALFFPRVRATLGELTNRMLDGLPEVADGRTPERPPAGPENSESAGTKSPDPGAAAPPAVPNVGSDAGSSDPQGSAETADSSRPAGTEQDQPAVERPAAPSDPDPSVGLSRAAFLGTELRDWVPYQVGDVLTYRTCHFREHGSAIDREEITRLRIHRQEPERGLLVEEGDEEPGAGEWWWLVGANGFRRTRVLPSGDGVPDVRTQEEVRWADGAPVKEWTVDRDRFSTRWVRAQRIGGQILKDLLLVEATREVVRSDGGVDRIERRTYFAQGYGEVLLETSVNGGLVMRRELVANP